MSSAVPIFGIFFAYLAMANLGPKIMSKRKPMELRVILVAYNLFIAGLNFWLVLEVGNSLEEY